ncbi:hypothetical protein Godav_029698, partial [Gossypium davidsonii]|nr:hypothetical protein [Gossypium davidsonii]
ISSKNASVHIRLLDRELIVENRFLDKVEDNAAVQIWSKATQREKWNDEVKQLFYSSYEDLPYLFDIKVDKHLFRALAQFWNPAYSCFTFGGGDLVPTVEEYIALLRCLKIEADRVYSRAVNVPTFLKKLINITGMSEQWVVVRIKQKGDSKCIPWKNLRDLILAHLNAKKKVDVFALSVYGLVVFPKALGHVDEAVTDLFDRLDKRVTLVPTILAKTLRSLNEYRRADDILYRCGNFDWVPLLGIWGAVGYAPLLVLRQYRSRQFVPATQGLAQCEFSYKGDGYKKNIREMSNAWNQTQRMKRLAVGSIAAPEYIEWWGRRINDNISGPSQGDSQLTRKHPQVVPSELKKKIEQMVEEKMNLRLGMDVQKLETEKLRKWKNKADGDLDSLKTDYKRLRYSMKAIGLGKTSGQWCQEIQEEKIKAELETLEKSLLEIQNEKGELKARVAELEKTLYQYRNRNSVIELRASLDKIEQMKRRVEELEMTLQSCEMRIEFLETSEER